MARCARSLSLLLLAFATILFASSCTLTPGIIIEVFSITNNPDGTLQSATVTFRASITNAESYLWDFGDGLTGSGLIVQHTYTAEGTFTVRLDVTTRSDAFVFVQQLEIQANIGTQPTIDLPNRAFVLSDSNDLSVIDLDTNTLLATVPVDDVDLFTNASQGRMAITPDGTRAYIVHPNLDKVSVIDLVNLSNPLIDIPVGNAPITIAITPDGTFAYVTNSADDNVSVIDLGTNTVTATIAAGDDPTLIGINPSGTRAYVTNLKDEDVSVLDLTTNTNLSIDFMYDSGILTPDELNSIAFSPDGTRAYVSVIGGNLLGSVLVFDLVNDALLTTISLPTDSIYQVVVSPDGTRGYVTELNANRVALLDLTNNSLLGTTIPAGNLPLGIALNSDGSKAYVTNVTDNDVAVLDLNTNSNLNMDIAVGGNFAFIIVVQE